MRKIVQTSDGEVRVLWQLWKIGGTRVVTMPAEMTAFAGTDSEGRSWMVLEERSLNSFALRLLSQRELNELNEIDEGKE